MFTHSAAIPMSYTLSLHDALPIWFCAACAAYKTEDEYQKGDPPTCLIHDTPLDRISEGSYFFRLSDYDEALLAVYASRRSEEHTSELQSRLHLVCRLLLEKKKKI